MPPSTQGFYQFYASPIGNLLLIANENGLLGIEFEEEQKGLSVLPEQKWQAVEVAGGEISRIFCRTRDVLDRYFAGDRVDFASLDFLAPQGTPFQQAVWRILLQIPQGETLTYGDIAQQLGKPAAMRAVGGAVGRNPISILIPCHRVLGKNRALTGFGGGLPVKRFLLNLEKIAFHEQGVEFVKPKNKHW